MTKPIWLLIPVAFTIPLCAQVPSQDQHMAQIALPAAAPTIPSDAMFALGQQAGRIEGLTERLVTIDADLKEIGKDVHAIKWVGGLISLVFTVILAPMAIEVWKNRGHAARRPPAPVAGD